MKRIISAVLACMMVFTVCAAADFENFKNTNEYVQGQFTDVAESAWYNESVQKAYELGLVKGNSETTFNPEGEITIAEALVLACRIHSIYNGGDGVFEQGNPWYQVYVDYAVENGIINANKYEDYTEKAQRSDFAVIMSDAVPAEALEKINNIEFIPDVVDWDIAYVEEVFLLYNAGVLTGSDEAGTFNPESTIKRSEVATIVTRIALPELRKEFTLPEATREQLEERFKIGVFSVAYCLDFIEQSLIETQETQDIEYCILAGAYAKTACLFLEATEKIANELGYFDYVEKAEAVSKVMKGIYSIDIQNTRNVSVVITMFQISVQTLVEYLETAVALIK